MICKHLGYTPKKVVQTWTRNMIQNDEETATIAQNSVGIVSRKTIIKNHPWVEDVETELKNIREEEEQDIQKGVPYQDQEGDVDVQE